MQSRADCPAADVSMLRVSLVLAPGTAPDAYQITIFTQHSINQETDRGGLGQAEVMASELPPSQDTAPPLRSLDSHNNGLLLLASFIETKYPERKEIISTPQNFTSPPSLCLGCVPSLCYDLECQHVIIPSPTYFGCNKLRGGVWRIFAEPNLQSFKLQASNEGPHEGSRSRKRPLEIWFLAQLS